MNCLLIVAAFCFSEANEAVLDQSSTVGRFAVIKVGDVRAEILIGSDSFADYDPRRMARACEKKTCISYHKWCEELDRGLNCSYTFGDTAYAQPVLTLRAPSRSSLAAAERRIAVFPDDRRTSAVPLQLLTKIAAKNSVPYCRPGGGRVPKCPPKQRR